MTDLTRNQPQTESQQALRMLAVLSLLLGIAGVWSWVPAVMLPKPNSAGAEGQTFIQQVANLALEQYTPNMRPVVYVLGTLFVLLSLVQIPASVGAWLGKEFGLTVLRVIAYLKIGLFVTSCLLVGLAVFSAVNPNDRPWTLVFGSWLLNVPFAFIYFWMIKAINRHLKRTDADLAFESDEDEEPPEPKAAVWKV